MNYIREMIKKEEVLNKAKEDYQTARIKAQTLCDHPKIVEGESVSGDAVSSSEPPFRVCTKCGYTEEGWGCGYSFLTKGYEEDRITIPAVDRKTAYEFVRGRVISNDEHIQVKLGRKELEEILK